MTVLSPEAHALWCNIPYNGADSERWSMPCFVGSFLDRGVNANNSVVSSQADDDSRAIAAS
jgi:hypothetical protein